MNDGISAHRINAHGKKTVPKYFLMPKTTICFLGNNIHRKSGVQQQSLQAFFKMSNGTKKNKKSKKPPRIDNNIHILFRASL